jgi:glutaredoxin
MVVKKYMEENKIPYGIIFLDKSPEAMSKFSSKGLRTVPVLDTGSQLIIGVSDIVKYLKVD